MYLPASENRLSDPWAWVPGLYTSQNTNMHETQQLLDFNTRTKLRLSEVERLIRKHRMIVPTPSRKKLIELCEEGVFETANRRTNREPYLVYEDSFLEWMRSFDG
jgi:hypothetical protein